MSVLSVGVYCGSSRSNANLVWSAAGSLPGKSEFNALNLCGDFY